MMICENISASLNLPQQDFWEIINDILDLSKVEAGKLNIIEEDYTTQSLTEDITAIINARNTENKVPIYYRIQENMLHILHGDAVRIKQFMLNYASNHGQTIHYVQLA